MSHDSPTIFSIITAQGAGVPPVPSVMALVRNIGELSSVVSAMDTSASSSSLSMNDKNPLTNMWLGTSLTHNTRADLTEILGQLISNACALAAHFHLDLGDACVHHAHKSRRKSSTATLTISRSGETWLGDSKFGTSLGGSNLGDHRPTLLPDMISTAAPAGRPSRVRNTAVSFYAEIQRLQRDFSKISPSEFNALDLRWTVVLPDDSVHEVIKGGKEKQVTHDTFSSFLVTIEPFLELYERDKEKIENISLKAAVSGSSLTSNEKGSWRTKVPPAAQSHVIPPIPRAPAQKLEAKTLTDVYSATLRPSQVPLDEEDSGLLSPGLRSPPSKFMQHLPSHYVTPDYLQATDPPSNDEVDPNIFSMAEENTTIAAKESAIEPEVSDFCSPKVVRQEEDGIVKKVSARHVEDPNHGKFSPDHFLHDFFSPYSEQTTFEVTYPDEEKEAADTAAVNQTALGLAIKAPTAAVDIQPREETTSTNTPPGKESPIGQTAMSMAPKSFTNKEEALFWGSIALLESGNLASANVATLGLTFQMPHRGKKVELAANGAFIPVTCNNSADFLRLLKEQQAIHQGHIRRSNSVRALELPNSANVSPTGEAKKHEPTRVVAEGQTSLLAPVTGQRVFYVDTDHPEDVAPKALQPKQLPQLLPTAAHFVEYISTNPEEFKHMYSEIRAKPAKLERWNVTYCIPDPAALVRTSSLPHGARPRVGVRDLVTNGSVTPVKIQDLEKYLSLVMEASKDLPPSVAVS